MNYSFITLKAGGKQSVTTARGKIVLEMLKLDLSAFGTKERLSEVEAMSDLIYAVFYEP